MNRILTGRQYLLQDYLHGSQVSQAFDDPDGMFASLRDWNPIAIVWRKPGHGLPHLAPELTERLKIAASPEMRNGILNTTYLRLCRK